MREGQSPSYKNREPLVVASGVVALRSSDHDTAAVPAALQDWPSPFLPFHCSPAELRAYLVKKRRVESWSRLSRRQGEAGKRAVSRRWLRSSTKQLSANVGARVEVEIKSSERTEQAARALRAGGAQVLTPPRGQKGRGESEALRLGVAAPDGIRALQ